jgi:hypothetical protein
MRDWRHASRATGMSWASRSSDPRVAGVITDSQIRGQPALIALAAWPTRIIIGGQHGDIEDSAGACTNGGACCRKRGCSAQGHRRSISLQQPEADDMALLVRCVWRSSRAAVPQRPCAACAAAAREGMRGADAGTTILPAELVYKTAMTALARRRDLLIAFAAQFYDGSMRCRRSWPGGATRLRHGIPMTNGRWGRCSGVR